MKAINTNYLDETLHITLCKDGYWLWDETRGMNLSMKAKTEERAMFDAIKYYQNRLLKVETELKEANQKLNTIFNIVSDDEREYNENTH